MIAGSAVTASIERMPSVLTTLTTPSVATTVIPALHLRAFRQAQIIFVPLTSQGALDLFGVAPEQATQVVADWDAAWTEEFPIRPGDTLVYGTARYYIHGVQPYPGLHVLLLVGATLTQS